MNKAKKILIGIPTPGTVRADFMIQLLNFKYGNYSIGYHILKANIVHIAREQILSAALRNNVDYVCFIDSDEIFPSDIIPRLAHYLDEGEDIVTSLVFTKFPPYNPCVYDDTIMMQNHQLKLVPTKLTEEKIKTPFYVKNCGAGAVMFKTKIAENIPQPWFHPYPYSGEDVSFFYNAVQSGYKILCDPTYTVHHYGDKDFNIKDYLEYQNKENELMDGAVKGYTYNK